MSGGTGNTIVSGAFTTDDFVGVFASLSLSPVDVVGRHLGEGEKGLAPNGCGADSGKTGVTVFTEDIGVNTLGTEVNTLT